MKTKSSIKVVHVISEPGDLTRYDYAYYRRYDDFVFMPIKNSFNYPQRLNYYDIKDLEETRAGVFELSQELNCNPCTLLECISTIKEYYNGTE